MERIAFLIESTGERVGAMLNPESIVVRRWAGVRPQRLATGVVAGTGADDPLVLTSGGTTEIELDLLFDVGIAGSSIVTENVRDLTAPLWAMSERDGRNATPAPVRFVWGKAWNLLVVVAAAAERLEEFSPGGLPRRSWLRMRMLRVQERPQPPRRSSVAIDGDALAQSLAQLQTVPADQITTHVVAGAGSADDDAPAGERLDQVAGQYYGDPTLWRVIAEFNGIDSPDLVAAGTALRIPPLDRASAGS